AGLVALVVWAQIVLGVAVFAIPDRYEGGQAVLLSVVALAIGILVPAAALWALREHGVLGRRSRTPGHPARRATVVPGAINGVAFEPGDETQPTQPYEPLTERELEVLRHVAAGKPNKEIAADLVITTGTVKTHTN